MEKIFYLLILRILKTVFFMIFKMTFIFLMLYINISIKNYSSKKISLLVEKNIFFEEKKEIKYSFFIFVLFLIFFVLMFRFLRLFLNLNNYLDLKIIYSILEFYKVDKVISIILILLLLFSQCRKIITILVKLNFLRLHYFFFSRYIFYIKSIKIINELEIKIFESLHNKIYFYILYVFFSHFIKLLLVIFFFKNFFFDDKVIYLGWLPWYALYYFLVNLISFFQNMEFDFERGSLQCYYPDEFCTTKLGYRKLYFYHKSLLLGISKYKFKNSMLYNLDLRFYIPNTWVFYYYRTFKILDIYSIASKKKPKILKKY